MFTKYTLVASLAVASMVATSGDVFAGGKRPGTRYSRPVFGSSRSCCVVVDPCAPAAAPGTYRSFSYEPSMAAPASRYQAPARSDMSRFLLPKTDPRRYSSGW